MSIEIVAVRAQQLSGPHTKPWACRDFWTAVLPNVFDPRNGAFGLGFDSDFATHKVEDALRRVDVLIIQSPDFQCLRVVCPELRPLVKKPSPALWATYQDLLQTSLTQDLQNNDRPMCYGIVALGRWARFFQQKQNDAKMQPLEMGEGMDIVDVIDGKMVVSRILTSLEAEASSQTTVIEDS